MMARVNKKWLAISLAIAGAIIVSALTGSAERANRKILAVFHKDAAGHYTIVEGLNPFECMVTTRIGEESKGCIQIREQHLDVMFNPAILIPLARDLALGFLAPLVLILWTPRLMRLRSRRLTKGGG